MSGGSASRVAPLRPRDPRELGGYTLEGRLGEGGMGYVYLARSGAGRLVAIKVIRSEYADDAEFRLRFRSEVQRAQQVPSYCTAEVLDSDPDHDPPYLVVEYVDGPSLSDVIRDRGPLSPGNLHGLAIGVAAALTAIHGAGVIHRDLKPSNVLLPPGSPKVIDFGIARPVDAPTGYTRSDQIMGTVAYMSPERFGPGGGRALTPAADIFAWGAVVAFAGTGRVPFEADSLHAMAYRIMTEPPELGGVSGPMRALVDEALAKDPSERPTARELLDRLTAVNATAVTVPTPRPDAPRAPTSSAPPDPTPATEAARGRPRRRGVLVALAALVMLLGGAGGVLAGMLVNGEPGQSAALPSATPTVTGGRTEAPTADPTGRPTVEPTGKPTAGPTGPVTELPVPAKAIAVVPRDPLSAPGLWKVRKDTDNKVTCEFDGALVVTSEQAVTYRCPGPKDAITDTAVFVTVTLNRSDSCAAVWFRFTLATGGYAGGICEDGYHLVVHNKEGRVEPLRTMRPAAPMGLDDPTRVGVVMEGQAMRVYQDDELVGEWSNPRFTEGQVHLGLLQSQDTEPPFQVSFADVEVWGVPAF